MKRIVGKNKLLFFLSYFYLIFPIMIFVVGWMKWYITVVGVSILLISMAFLIKHTPDIEMPLPNNKKEFIKFTIVLISLFLVVRLSGIGNSVAQTSDHYWRNTIFEALVEYDWPVKEVDVYGGSRGLVYYISFWLPSALIGKLFGLYAGYAFQVLWGYFGLLLIYLFICSFTKRVCLYPIFIFIFFSGLDEVSHALEIIYYGGYPLSGQWATEFLFHIEWHSINYFSINYLSNITNIYWIYNQTIPLWVSLFIILNLKDNKSIIFIVACTILSSILSVLALAPFLIYFVFSDSVNDSLVNRKFAPKSEIKNKFKELFSIENLLGGFFVLSFSLAYLFPVSDPSQSQVATNGIYLGIHLADPKAIIFYSLYLFFEFGIYFILVYREQKSNGIFYLSLIMLLFVPILSIGTNQDFCMKGSVPYLMIVCLFLIESIECSIKSKSSVRFCILIEVFIVGTITSLREIFRLGRDTFVVYQNNNFFYDGTLWLVKDILFILLLIGLFYLFMMINAKKYRNYIIYSLTFLLVVLSIFSIITFETNYVYYLRLAVDNNNWNIQAPIDDIFIVPNFSGSTSYNLFYKFFAK